MNIEFIGKLLYFQGPSPYHFVTVPDEQSQGLIAISSYVTYDWGRIPVLARIGNTEWKTSLFSKNGDYLVPIEDSVWDAEHLVIGDTVTLRLELAQAK